MDESFFTKYKKQIQKQKNKKQDIISLIKELTTIELKEEEVEIDGINIKLYISSSKKSILTQKGLPHKIKEHKYNIFFN